MNLIKVRNGLLEQDNYYMTSNFSDFLGVGTTTRTTDSLYINTAERIERLFTYDDFLIQVRKENWTTANEGDSFIFYIGDSIDEYGIRDDWNDKDSFNEYQRILFLDGFAQFYTSTDNITWTLINSVNLKDRKILTQGFRKVGTTPLRLMDFTVYKSPIVTIQNFPENYKVEFYNTSNELLLTRLFMSNEEAELAITNSTLGYLKVYNTSNVLEFTSETMQFNFGDVFLCSDFALEVIYNGLELEEGETTMLSATAPEKITIRNISDTKNYTNLSVSSEIESNDVIEVSLDGITFTPTVVINLPANAEIDMYISIIKGNSSQSFVSRDFLLKIE